MALSKITTESLLDGEITAAKFATGVGGKVVQVVNAIDSAVATGTTVMVTDDTIPQKTEGVELMTLAITPTSASNKLFIQIQAVVSHTAATTMHLGLFQDTTANALAGTMNYESGSTGHFIISLNHYMTSGTSSSTTFKFRAGGAAAGTITFNGASGSRFFGGSMASSITITEISV